VVGARELSNDFLLRCYAAITVKAANPTSKKTKALASQYPLWNSHFTLYVVCYFSTKFCAVLFYFVYYIHFILSPIELIH
jgi:hypothetical protein